jgi:hypothetical protein
MNTTTTTVGIRLQLEGASAVERGLAGVQSRVSDAAKALTGLAAGTLSAAAFTSWIRGAIDAADQTEELAQKTGLLAEEVAGLQLLFKQEGLGDQFGQVLSKLAKGAADGNKAFVAMGLSVTDASGKLKSTRDLLGEVADQFSTYKDGPEKAALAMQLFGKSGADLIPLLNGGAASMREFDARAKAMGLTISSEVAAAAGKFNDDLFLMQSRIDGVAVSLAGPILAGLNGLIGKFQEGAREGENFLLTLLKQTEIARLFGQNRTSNAYTDTRVELERLNAALSSGKLNVTQTLALEEKRAALAKQMAGFLSSTAGAGRGFINPQVVLRAQAPRVSEIDEATRATGRNTAAKKANTDADKEAAKVAADLAKTRERIAEIADRETDDVVRRVTGLIEANEVLREEVAMVGASADKRAELVSLKEREAIAQLELNLIVAQSNGASEASIALMQQEINLRRQRLALIDEKAAAESANAVQEETYAALRNIGQRADTEWDRTADYLGEALAGGIAAGFSSGKGFADGFFDYLAAQLKRAFAQELSNSIKGGVQSYLTGNNSGLSNSALGAAWQAYSGGSVGASSASLAYANAVGAFGGDSIGALYAANGGWAGVSAGAGGAGSAAGAAGVAGAGGAGASGAGASSGLIGAAGYAALIVAAIAIANNLYDKGYTRAALGIGDQSTVRFGGFSSYTADKSISETSFNKGFASNEIGNMRKLLQALGTSEKWADILSSTTGLATLVGRKLSAVGFEADIAGGEANVGGFARYKGGLFRSNKTVGIAVDSGDSAAVKQQVESVLEGSRAMARAMGLSSEAIDNYTGKIRINMKGAETAAEQSERMAKAMDDLQFSLLKAAAGGKYSREEFERMMEGVRESMAAVGITGESIATILVQGMTGRLSSAEVGDQLASTIIGGIYTAIASNYAGVIAQAFTNQIITPIFTALAAGVPISQAISQSAINSVVATANQAAAALNAIFNDAGFLSAIAGIQQAISGVTGAVGSISVPEINNSLAEAESQRYQIESELLGLLGNTTALRERELAGLEGSARALKLHVYALQDSRAAVEGALSAIQRSADAERDRLTGLLDIAAEAEAGLNDVFKTLRDSIRSLRGDVDSTASLDSRAARDQIARAISGAIKLNNDDLVTAIDAVRTGLDDSAYASRFERDRAFLRFAGELSSLEEVTQRELTNAEQQVALLEDQLTALDLQVDLAQKQVDALFGVDNSIKSMGAAVVDLQSAMATYTGAVSAAMAQSYSSGGAPSGGGGFSFGGGFESAPQSGANWTADGYWAKNADLRDYWGENAGVLERARQFNADPNLSARDEYLKWHYQTYGANERRAFARGGYYPGGLALVGEEGPEIINFKNPGQVYTAAQTQGLLGGGGEQTNRLLSRLIERIDAIGFAQVSEAKVASKVLRRWDADGMPETREVSA